MFQKKRKMGKFLSFLELCAYVVGFIGGIGYACHSKAYLIACCVGLLGIMAFGEAKKAFKRMFPME